MPVKHSRTIGVKVKKMTAEIEQALKPAVYAIADMVKTDAQISLSTGAVSGAKHKPSAPGTPPNTDTGHLADSIEVEIVGPTHARVVALAEYAAIQELGGTINHPGGTAYFIDDKTGLAVFVPDSSVLSLYLPRTKPHPITLPERPYMRPAAAKNREPGVKLMRAAIDRVLNGGKIT